MVDQQSDPHLSGTEARAGTKTGKMRYVLGLSLVLVIVLFVILFTRPFG